MTQTAYDDIEIRMYVAFPTPIAFEHMLDNSELLSEEKEQIRECVTPCVFGKTKTLVLSTNRKPGKDLPSLVYKFAAAIYEIYPYESHFNVRKDCGVDLSAGLHDFGFDLPVFSGRLQAFML